MVNRVKTKQSGVMGNLPFWDILDLGAQAQGKSLGELDELRENGFMLGHLGSHFPQVHPAGKSAGGAVVGLKSESFSRAVLVDYNRGNRLLRNHCFGGHCIFFPLLDLLEHPQQLLHEVIVEFLHLLALFELSFQPSLHSRYPFHQSSGGRLALNWTCRCYLRGSVLVCDYLTLGLCIPAIVDNEVEMFKLFVTDPSVYGYLESLFACTWSGLGPASLAVFSLPVRGGLLLLHSFITIGDEHPQQLVVLVLSSLSLQEESDFEL